MSLAFPRRAQCAVCLARRFPLAAGPSSTIPRPSHTRSRALTTSPTANRQPSSGPSANAKFGAPDPHLQRAHSKYGLPRPPPSFSAADYAPVTTPRATALAGMLLNALSAWCDAERTADKLAAYGFTAAQQASALGAWRGRMRDGLSILQDAGETEAEMALAKMGWDLLVLQDGTASDAWDETLEASLTRNFLTFSSSLSTLPTALRSRLEQLLASTDISQLALSPAYLPARSLSRAFHIHCGPTNSGKTYNALKALSRAPSGAYAGPLRLLAHEVWERLNLGTVGDLGGVGRECNLLTGEERRVVSPSAGLISCTVEMLPPTRAGMEPYDVVVIDEIQMLADPQRGGAWTAAVLGVMAREVHVCGDETTVELLQRLVPSLGDTVTVHRYDRLTPLAVADKSLESDWNKIETGDCVVTFSRSNIFSVKRLIESTTGKKCAVVYGALPPETRAEQAKDFNEGRAEVLVASDAVGMGLNLKIKRVIFEALHKFNGKTEVPLALTSVKQIAGRAGRYGMHKTVTAVGLDADKVDPEADEDESVVSSTQLQLDAEPPTSSQGGSVTTLHSADLPILRSLLPLPLPSVSRAVLEMPQTVLNSVYSLLPADTSYAKLLEHASALALLPPHLTRGTLGNDRIIAETIEPHRANLHLSEVQNLVRTPVSARDPVAISIFASLVKTFATTGSVPLVPLFQPSRLLHTLENVEITLATLPPLPPIAGIGRRPLTPPILVAALPQLETLHKTLVAYIWLSFRTPIAYPDAALAQELKGRTEEVLDQCLARMPGLRQKFSRERSREMDREVAKWRREHSAPNGRKVGMDRKTLFREVQRLEEERERTGQRVVWQSQAADEAKRRKKWGKVAVPKF